MKTILFAFIGTVCMAVVGALSVPVFLHGKEEAENVAAVNSAYVEYVNWLVETEGGAYED